MGNYEAYLEEQEGRLRELESKIEMVQTRLGMAEDPEERIEYHNRLKELEDMMDLYAGMIEELGQSGAAWEDAKESVEKAYLNMKEALIKAGGGLVR